MGLLSGISKGLFGKAGKSSSTTDPAQVWKPQSPYLTGMYSESRNLANSMMYGEETFDKVAYDAAMADYNSKIAGGRKGITARLKAAGPAPTREQFTFTPTAKSLEKYNRFQGQMSAQNDAWRQQLAGAQNPYLTGMAANAMNQISRQFNEQIMPSLLGGGNAAGQLGGARYQMLQDSAVRAAAEGMGNAANEVYGNMAALGLQGQSQAIGQGNQVMNAQWLPLFSQSAILGSPTVLGGGAQQQQKEGSKGLLGGISASLAIPGFG